MLLITRELNKILHNAHTKLHLRDEPDPTAVEEPTIIKHQFCSTIFAQLLKKVWVTMIWGLLIVLPVNVLMYCFDLLWLFG